MFGIVAGKYAVSHDWAAVIVKHPAAHRFGRIAAEGAVGDCRAAAFAAYPAASISVAVCDG